MKYLVTIVMSVLVFVASAQSDIDYPYNPDFENDGFVGIEDVLELLSVYGTPFTPEQLLLDGASLTEIIESLQSQIDSLASYTNEGFGAIALNDSLLTEYLVGIAAASEEGDSALGAWVMQLSEVVEQQQGQIESLSSALPTPIDSMLYPNGEHTFEILGDYRRIDVGVPPIDRFDVYWYENGYQQNNNVAVSEVMEFVSNTPNVIWVRPHYDPITIQIEGVSSDMLTIAIDQIFPSEQEWSTWATELEQAATVINTDVSIPSFHFPDHDEDCYPSISVLDGEIEVISFRWAHTQWNENAFSSNGELVTGSDCRAATSLMTLRTGGRWVVSGDLNY